jgi:hypothetical protein
MAFEDQIEVFISPNNPGMVVAKHKSTNLEAHCCFYKDASKNKAIAISMLQAGVYSLEQLAYKPSLTKEYYGY